MKDEIKEIYLSNENSRFIGTHDNMGCVMINGILTKNITYEEYVDIISKAKYFLLVNKDYITNLQEENERLKKENTKLYKKDTKIINDLELNQTKKVFDTIAELIKDGETCTYRYLIYDLLGFKQKDYVDLMGGLAITNMLVDYQDHKSRIDKAVEYIENDLKSFLYSIEYKTLLNILNGDDNN